MSLATENPPATSKPATTGPARVFRWLLPAPHVARLSQADVVKLYPAYRWRIFEAAFIAYATFYLVRNNLAPVADPLKAALHHDKVMFGHILSGTAIAYGIG